MIMAHFNPAIFQPLEAAVTETDTDSASLPKLRIGTKVSPGKVSGAWISSLMISTLCFFANATIFIKSCLV